MQSSSVAPYSNNNMENKRPTNGIFNSNENNFNSSKFDTFDKSSITMSGEDTGNNQGTRETGIIEKLLCSYGVIQCWERRLCFHASQFEGDTATLEVGDRVEFKITHDRRTGKPIASIVTKIAPEMVLREERVIGSVPEEVSAGETQGRITYEKNKECFFLPFCKDDVEGNVTLEISDRLTFQITTNNKKPDRQVLRNNSNNARIRTNKNSEFKVPFSPRLSTEQNQEGSALQCLKPIVEKLVMFDEIKIVPQEELRKLTSELNQKIDTLCTNSLIQRLKEENNQIINNGSDLHTIISQGHTYQPSSVRSCVCQGSTCENEIEKFAPSVNGRSSRINTMPRSQSAVRPRANGSRSTQPRKKTACKSSESAASEDELVNFLENRKRISKHKTQPRKKRKTEGNSKTKRVSKKATETKEHEPVKSICGEANEERIICGYDQTDQEMFGDYSTIINNSMGSNIRCTSAMRVTSTPLLKALPRAVTNKRLKNPDVASEFKGPKSRSGVKRIVRKRNYSSFEFSDDEENSDKS